MEFLIYMALLAAAISYPVWGSYFGDVTGDHANGVAVEVYVLDHEQWKADQKTKRARAIRLALST